MLANSYLPPSTIPLPDLLLQSYSLPTLMEKCKEEALKRGDISTFLAMPINYQNKKSTQYAQPQFELIKEVSNAVRDCGLQTPYTMGWINSINHGYTMAPNDW